MERRVWAVCWFVLLGLPVALPGGDAMPTEWPTVQGDFARTGFHGEIHGPGTGDVLWTYRPDSLVFDAIAAVANGQVYVGDGEGLLHAISAFDGKRVWTYQVGAPVEASAVGEGFVYIVDSGGTLHAIIATSGEYHWDVETQGPANVAVYNETVIYVANKEVVHAVDAYTRKPLWHYNVNDRPYFSARTMIIGSPLVAHDSVIFGSADSRLYSISASEGSLKWEVDLENGLHGSPAAGEGLGFVLDGPNRLCAFHLDNGTGAWCSELESPTNSFPAYRNGTVFVAGERILAINAENGEQRWEITGVGRPTGNLALSATTMYVVSEPKTLMALDLATQVEQWNRTFTAQAGSSPVVVDGVLYVGTEQLGVVALDAGAGRDLVPRPWPYHLFPQSIPTVSPILLLPLLVVFWKQRRV